jgi:hypothetical protein
MDECIPWLKPFIPKVPLFPSGNILASSQPKGSKYSRTVTYC